LAGEIARDHDKIVSLFQQLDLMEKRVAIFACYFPDDIFVKQWIANPDFLSLLAIHVDAVLSGKPIDQFFSDHGLKETDLVDRLWELTNSKDEKIALHARMAAIKLQTRLKRCDIIACHGSSNPLGSKKLRRSCPYKEKEPPKGRGRSRKIENRGRPLLSRKKISRLQRNYGFLPRSSQRPNGKNS
jgi:hypothetical protein